MLYIFSKPKQKLSTSGTAATKLFLS